MDFFSLDHDRCAMRIAARNKTTGIAPHALEADPNIGLDIIDQMSQVHGAIGIGQGCGDKNFAHKVIILE